MKKILVCLFALLFGVAGTVNATKHYASFSVATGCTWDSGTNTMGFTAVNGWQILWTGFPGGDITAYKKFHATLSGMSDNIGYVRLRIKDNSDHYADVNLVTGENNIDLAALSVSNPTCDFTNINDITIWSPTSAAAGKVVNGEHPASVTITNAYIESGITGFGNVITSLSGITDGTRFVISDNGTKAKYFYNSGSANENKNANVEEVPADAYCYFTLEKYTGGDVVGDNIYRIKITNAEDEGYPNGTNGGCYLNSLHDVEWAHVVISAPQGGWSCTKDALWYVTYDAEKGFSFQNVCRATNGKGLKSWLSIGNDLVADQQYLKLYESIDFGVNTTVDMNVNITVDEETRNYQLYVPGNVDEDCPLVISLHGAYGGSTNYIPFTREVAAAQGCIVAYPQGKLTHFPIGFDGDATGWTATGEDNFDVKFLKAVIEDVASKYQIDRKRIYCCGFSNGGMMTYAMANACSDEIAAFASISGYPINEFHLRHTSSRPVPFLHIHGKADNFVLYEKMPTIVDEMVARMGANPVPTTTTVSGKYTKSIYGAGEGGFPYVYYEVDGMGHEAFTNNTEDGNSALTMWNFFKDYTLDSPSDETLKWAPRIETAGFTPTTHGFTMNDGTTLLSFGGAQYTEANKNVYASLQFESGTYKLCFKSTGASGKTIGVRLVKLTSPNTVVLNTTVNVGDDAKLPFEITDGWGEYQLTMTRPDAGDIISITDLAIVQTEEPDIPEPTTLDFNQFGVATTDITDLYATGGLKYNPSTGVLTSDGTAGTLVLAFATPVDLKNLFQFNLAQSGSTGDILSRLEFYDEDDAKINTWNSIKLGNTWNPKGIDDNATNAFLNHKPVKKMVWPSDANASNNGKTATITSVEFTCKTIACAKAGETILRSLPWIEISTGDAKTPDWNMNGSSDTYYGNYSGDPTHYADLTAYSELRVYCKSNSDGFRAFFIKPDKSGTNTVATAAATWNSTEKYYSVDLSKIDMWDGKVALKSIKSDPWSGTTTGQNVTNIVVYQAPAANAPQYTLTGSGMQLAETVAALADATATCIDATGVTGITTNSEAGRTLLTSANPNCLFLGTTGNGGLANTQNVITSGTCANLVLTDGYPFAAPAGATATAATYSRSMGNKFGTICLPYAVSSNDDVKYYTIKELRSDALSLTAVTDLPAGTPAVVEKVSGSGITATGAGALAGVETTTGALRLIGTFVPTVISASDYAAIYAISNNEFVKATNTITLNPFRAFFAADSSAAKLRLIVEDDATAIEGLTDSAARVEGIYSVDGARRPSLQRGLNVVKMSNGVTTKVYVK